MKIKVSNEMKEIANTYAPELNIGGRSNLSKERLAKVPRLEFQYTGLYGELAWYQYRYNDLSKFIEVQEQKNSVIKKGKGDNGYDDKIFFDKDRLIDIKTSHILDDKKIKTLNLIVSPNEYHENSIYISAFAIGKDRINVDEVVLQGYALSEDITERWFIDKTKYAVKVSKLKDIKDLYEKF